MHGSDNDDPEASQGFQNLKNAAEDSSGGQIREGLEQLWSRFEPYADKEFVKEFGRHAEDRFWEMYLGNRLLEGRKALRKRSQLPKKECDAGPGFCIQKGPRKDLDRSDRAEHGRREQSRCGAGPVRLRRRQGGTPQDRAADRDRLKTKAGQFARYREKGIIGPRDNCIVAIAASQFALEADAESGAGLPLPVTTVFPSAKR